MKYLAILAAAAAFVSCQQPPVHDVVYVPYQTTKTVHHTTVEKPKKESAEEFEAVKKPGTYSN